MTEIVQTRYGTMECLRGDGVVSRSLMRYGEWAQVELDLLAMLVRPGMVVLDVGAFLGTHTLALATMVGPQGVVHSFEPRAGIGEILRRNVERNGLGQVRVHGYALGAATARLELPWIDLDGEANFGGLSLEGQGPAAVAGATETIAIERLDDLNLGRVDFIKLDAEGMEAEVLAGAARTIAQHRPLLFAECNDLERGGRTLAVCLSMGYWVGGVLSPAFNPANLRGDSDNIFGEAVEASLVALPREKTGLLSVLADTDCRLAPITTLDDLALLLLHKAQYPAEVLAAGPAFSVLGHDYPSPLARRQRDLIAELEHAVGPALHRAQDAERRAEAAEQCANLAEHRAELAERRANLAEDRAELAERRVELGVRGAAGAQAAVAYLQRSHAQAARYRRTSLTYWAERLRSRLRGGSP